MYQIDPRRDAYQRAVIELDNGYHLVLASAGCGKTDILAERVARHLANGGDPQKMICLTFTNRAARGMKERINMVSGADSADIFVGNTHRFCSNFLYNNGLIAQSSSILDENDTYSLVFNLMGRDDSDSPEALSFGERGLVNYILGLQHFFHQLRRRHPGSLLLFNEGQDQLQSLIKQLCGEMGAAATYTNLLQIYDNAAAYLSTWKDRTTMTYHLLEKMAIAKAYEVYKQEKSLVDFDDLLLLTYDYATTNPDSIPHYDWIQIDEVQDLNTLQIAIIDLFTDKDKNVTLYLGDSQQAIFSFIGAKLQTLNNIRQRCGQNVHHLAQCYRSPRYLLDIFNKYAAQVLDTPVELLPQTADTSSAEYGDLAIVNAATSSQVPQRVIDCLSNFPEGRIAIIVNSNACADEIAAHMSRKKLGYFKISGSDIFKSPTMQFIFSHLSVIYNDMNYLAWAKIGYTLGVFNAYRNAREWAFSLRDAGLSPSDFIQRKGSSLLLDFAKSCSSQPFVIFDTETTGLDLVNDDIVQIAAVKIINGQIIDSFNIILRTTRQIPKMLGTIVNPLVEEYARACPVDRQQGLMKFIEFAADNILIAHNLDFDYNILDYNLRRDCGFPHIADAFPVCYDSLRIARLLYPKLKSFRLKSLLQSLGLEGSNTHLADDDVAATVSLVNHCLAEASRRKDLILQAINDNAAIGQKFHDAYGDIYQESRIALFRKDGNITNEMTYIYKIFRQRLAKADKMNYVINFINNEVIDTAAESTMYTQLSLHLNDLNMYHEADLCGSESISDRVFISTVHKAKGLEFENVIVVNVVDGVYPFFNNKDNENGRKEDARRLYVAMTRARKRLYLITYNLKEVFSANGLKRTFNTQSSPFIKSIAPMFKAKTQRSR